MLESSLTAPDTVLRLFKRAISTVECKTISGELITNTEAWEETLGTKKSKYSLDGGLHTA